MYSTWYFSRHRLSVEKFFVISWNLRLNAKIVTSGKFVFYFCTFWQHSHTFCVEKTFYCIVSAPFPFIFFAIITLKALTCSFRHYSSVQWFEYNLFIQVLLAGSECHLDLLLWHLLIEIYALAIKWCTKCSFFISICEHLGKILMYHFCYTLDGGSAICLSFFICLQNGQIVSALPEKIIILHISV